MEYISIFKDLLDRYLHIWVVLSTITQLEILWIKYTLGDFFVIIMEHLNLVMFSFKSILRRK